MKLLIPSRNFLSQIFLYSLFFLSVAQADSNGTFFSKGVKEYKENHYSAALEFFLAAKNGGLESAQLFHNLGVVYLKIGQLDHARKSFLQCLEYPSVAPLAYYNLALLALKTGDDDTASTHLNQVIILSQDSNLTELARRKLSGGDTTIVTTKQWQILIRAGKGYDDNVNFAPEDTGSGNRDSYNELLLYGTAFLTRSKPIGVALDAYIYDVNFDDINTNDFSQSSLLLRFPIHYLNWIIQPALIAKWSRYGGKGYQNINGFELSSKYYKTQYNYYLAKYTFEKINSLNSQYDFLEGARQRLKLESQYLHNAYKINFYYELETNNRTDRRNQSYSPQRNTVSGKITYALNDVFSINGGLKYRLSDYPKIVTFNRYDKQFELSVGGQFKLNKHTYLRCLYTHTENGSSDARRDYDRQRLIFSVQLFY